nr:Chain B, Nuclear receptor 0B2 [synthetic construct]
PAILYALLSS